MGMGTSSLPRTEQRARHPGRAEVLVWLQSKPAAFAWSRLCNGGMRYAARRLDDMLVEDTMNKHRARMCSQASLRLTSWSCPGTICFMPLIVFLPVTSSFGAYASKATTSVCLITARVPLLGSDPSIFNHAGKQYIRLFSVRWELFSVADLLVLTVC